jgi:hypothetical protein
MHNDIIHNKLSLCPSSSARKKQNVFLITRRSEVITASFSAHRQEPRLADVTVWGNSGKKAGRFLMTGDLSHQKRN